MKTECTNLLLLTISAFWSSPRWPLATYMSSRRQRSIQLGGRYIQVSLYIHPIYVFMIGADDLVPCRWQAISKLHTDWTDYGVESYFVTHVTTIKRNIFQMGQQPVVFFVIDRFVVSMCVCVCVLSALNSLSWALILYHTLLRNKC